MSEPSPQIPRSPHLAIKILFGFLAGWSLLIAVGAIVMATQFDVRKPLIVLGTMGAFLMVWWAALKLRRERSDTPDRHSK